jgi:hypothetical protein
VVEAALPWTFSKRRWAESKSQCGSPKKKMNTNSKCQLMTHSSPRTYQNAHTSYIMYWVSSSQIQQCWTRLLFCFPIFSLVHEIINFPFIHSFISMKTVTI